MALWHGMCIHNTLGNNELTIIITKNVIQQTATKNIKIIFVII